MKGDLVLGSPDCSAIFSTPSNLRDALQQLSSVTKEKRNVQKRLEDTEAKLRRLSTTNKLDVSLPTKKDLKELLELQAKTILWGMVKFIQSPSDERVDGSQNAC
jgi:hypothetical protein